MVDLDAFDRSLLGALQAGFRARAGLKERFQALSEYELARRLGIDSYSYVEYDTSPERDAVRAALGRLQRLGLVRLAAVSGRYETFVPAHWEEEGGVEVEVEVEVGIEPPAATTASTLEQRLDEIVRLLTSIDQRLGRLEGR